MSTASIGGGGVAGGILSAGAAAVALPHIGFLSAHISLLMLLSILLVILVLISLGYSKLLKLAHR